MRAWERRKLLQGVGVGRRPILPPPRPPCREGGVWRGGCPTCGAGGLGWVGLGCGSHQVPGGGGSTPTHMAQNDSHVALKIFGGKHLFGPKIVFRPLAPTPIVTQNKGPGTEANFSNPPPPAEQISGHPVSCKGGGSYLPWLPQSPCACVPVQPAQSGKVGLRAPHYASRHVGGHHRPGKVLLVGGGAHERRGSFASQYFRFRSVSRTCLWFVRACLQTLRPQGGGGGAVLWVSPGGPSHCSLLQPPSPTASIPLPALTALTFP